jgi:hypothetical protein
MRFTIDIHTHPESLNNSTPEDTARALAGILNHDLNFFWSSAATVTPVTA